MENMVSFKSKRYKKITWSTIFNAAAIAVSPDKKSFGLSNANGFTMACFCITVKNTLQVCQLDNLLVDIHVKELNCIDCSFQDKEVLVFQMPTCKTNRRLIANLYMNFHNQVLYQLYQACKSILVYTHDHLSSRSYGNKTITKIETVESHFQEIIILLGQVSPFILKLKSMDEVNYLLSSILNILKTISRLSGARAVLSGNALELAFYVRLFQRFIAE